MKNFILVGGAMFSLLGAFSLAAHAATVCDVKGAQPSPSWPKERVEINRQSLSVVYVYQIGNGNSTPTEDKQPLLDAAHASGYTINLYTCNLAVTNSVQSYSVSYTCGAFPDNGLVYDSTSGSVLLGLTTHDGSIFMKTVYHGQATSRSISLENCREQ